VPAFATLNILFTYLVVVVVVRTWMTDAGSRFVLQLSAKPLQLATLLLLTAHRNLPTPYPTIPSPTLYDVPFSHNAKRYRQTTDRRTDDSLCHQRNR